MDGELWLSYLVSLDAAVLLGLALRATSPTHAAIKRRDAVWSSDSMSALVPRQSHRWKRNTLLTDVLCSTTMVVGLQEHVLLTCVHFW